MPGLLLDDGSWKELEIPSSVTIGRSGDNTIQPESQSVSKKHATFSLEIDNKGRQVSSIEDHSSRNGTFYGPSPYDREMMRVTGKATIPIDSYLKFGNSNTYFRYLEHKPEEAPIAYDPIAGGTALEQRESKGVKKGGMGESNLGIGQENVDNQALIVAPLRSASPTGMMLSSAGAGAGAGTGAESLRSSQGSTGAGGLQPPVLASSQNMMISIQYPNGETNPMSIHIDPHGQGPPNSSVYGPSSNRASNRSNPIRSSHGSHDDGPRSPPPRGSKEGLSRSREWQDMASDASPPQGEIGRGVQRYISQASSSPRDIENDYLEAEQYMLDDVDDDMPPPLEEAGVVVDARVGRSRGRRSRGGTSRGEGGERMARRDDRGQYSSPSNRDQAVADLDLFRVQRTSSDESDVLHGHHGGAVTRSNPFPLSPLKGSFGFPYPGKQSFHEKPNPLLVRRAWVDLSVLNISVLSSRVVNLLNEHQMFENYDESSALPTSANFGGEVPAYVQSEAVADRFQDAEDTVCGKLGGAISELNDLLKQAVVGAQVRSPESSTANKPLLGASSEGKCALDEVFSAEIDAALATLVNDILVRSINTLHDVMKHQLVTALAEADRSGECNNDVYDLLMYACRRLEQLLAFINKTWMAKESNKARSSERYCIVAFCVHSVLSEVDVANALLFSVTQDAADEAELHANPLGKGKAMQEVEVDKATRSSGGGGGGGKSMRSSLDNGASLQLEIEELRRLKSKANRKGGSAALTAQIRQLEERAASHGMGPALDGSFDLGPVFKPDGGPGEQSQRYNSVEMKKLREQEAAGNQINQRLLRVCRIIDNNILKFQYWGLRRWKNLVSDMKSNYTNKMRHFANILKERGHFFARRAVRLLQANAQRQREQQMVDQVRAELRYEMCGMQRKIHELSSNNTLAASLAAERALNRELTDLNLELRKSVTELDTKLLEAVNVHPSMRKELVRDVLFGREDALSVARREAKSLRDELQDLYDLGIALPEGPRKNVMERPPVPSAYARPKDPNAELVPESIERAQKNTRDTGPLQDGKEASRPLALKDQPLPETASGLASKKQFLPHRGDLSKDNPSRPLVKKGLNKELAPVHGRFMDEDNRNLTNGLSRKDATIIIAKEVRRLSEALRNTTFSRNTMQKRLTHDATKHMSQTLAIQALQKRITDRERSMSCLRKLLRDKVGDKGMVDLTIALEDSGVGNSAIMMEPSSLDDPTIEYSNVEPLEPFRFGPPGNPEKPGDLADHIKPVDVSRQRESYQDAVDDALEVQDPNKALAKAEADKRVLDEAGKKADIAFPVPQG